MKFAHKVSISFIAVSISLVLIILMIFFVQERTIFEERLHNQFESIAVLKEHSLNTFFIRAMYEIEEISNEERVINYALNSSDCCEKEKVDFFDYISNKLEHGGFEEVFLINSVGEVIASTTKENIGKIHEKKEYFLKGKESTFIQNVYYDSSLKKPAIVISTPLIDSQGNNIGVVAGKSKINEISSLMTQRIGLGKTGETYLVNKYNYAITNLKKQDASDLQKAIYTQGVKDCIEGIGSFSYFYDYNEEKTLALHRWIPERELCLVIQIDESEALESLKNMQKSIILASIIMVFVSIAVSGLLSRSLSRPISYLMNNIKNVEGGQAYVKNPKKTKDEIGVLSSSFEQMIDSLEAVRKKLKEYNKSLEEKVEIRTKELKKSLEKLEEMDKMKINFLNVVTHELKTPLTAIIAYLDIIEDSKGLKGDPDAKKGIETIKRNAHQLNSLIGNILEVARIESGKFELSATEMNVGQKIDEVIENLGAVAKNKGLKLIAKKEAIPDKIITDEQRFEEILNNLISNAIKFTDKGTITVKAVGQKECVEISVKDTGIGIPRDKVKDLFQDFYQVDGSISRRYGGTGLGLSITKKLVELQGGSIVVKSKENEGSEFIFTLPLKPLEKKNDGKTKKDTIR